MDLQFGIMESCWESKKLLGWLYLFTMLFGSGNGGSIYAYISIPFIVCCWSNISSLQRRLFRNSCNRQVCRRMCIVISGGMVIYAACFAGNCYCNTYSDCDMLFGKIGWIDNCGINKDVITNRQEVLSGFKQLLMKSGYSDLLYLLKWWVIL